MSDQPRLGPTVAEAAAARINAIDRKIAELAREKRWCVARLLKYRGSSMLESERVATEAEPFQQKQLPALDKSG